MAVLLGSGAQLGGGTSQRLRPGGASVGMKGMRGMGMPRLCDLQGFSGTSIRSGPSGLVALSFPIPLIPHSRLHLPNLADAAAPPRAGAPSPYPALSRAFSATELPQRRTP